MAAVRRAGYRAAGTNVMLSSTTALLGCIQKIQEPAKGDFVVGMSKGVALSTDGTKAFKAGDAAKRRGAGR